MKEHNRLPRVRRQIRESEELTAADREILNEFDDEMQIFRGNRFSRVTHRRHLNVMKIFAKKTESIADLIVDDDLDGKALEDARQEAGEAAKAINEVVKKYESGWTQNAKVSSVQVFVELMGDQSLIPDFEKYLSMGYVDDSDDPTPLPAEVLEWESDIIPMIEAARYLMYAAMVAVAWASGLRPKSELHKLQWKHIDVREDEVVITTQPHAKTGRRDVHIDAGAPILKKWLRNHPVHDDGGPSPETPIWVRMDIEGVEHLSYSRFSDIFKEVGEAAGISKPTNPENFRASRASVLARHADVNQRTLEQFMGWVKGSKVANHYIANFSEAAANQVKAADGREIPEEDRPDPIVPVECPNCGERTPRHRDECIWCPTAIDPEADTTDRNQAAIRRTEEYKQAREDVVRMVTNGELTQEDIETARDLEKAIRKHPGLLDEIEELRALIDETDDTLLATADD